MRLTVAFLLLLVMVTITMTVRCLHQCVHVRVVCMRRIGKFVRIEGMRAGDMGVHVMWTREKFVCGYDV